MIIISVCFCLGIPPPVVLVVVQTKTSMIMMTIHFSNSFLISIPSYRFSCAFNIFSYRHSLITMHGKIAHLKNLNIIK